MKRIASRVFYLFAFFLFLLSSLFSACGSSGDQFHLEGRFKNLNQGEFYLYDLEQGSIDTLMVKDGRFSITKYLKDTVTLTLLFPNFSELPIFARPGAEVTIKGDVSHLKETQIKGTKENKAMTDFRMRTNELMPPEVVEDAERFILREPSSPVSFYLLRRYFLLASSPDYQKCYQLCDTMCKSLPNSIPMAQLRKQLRTLRQHRTKGKLPRFKAVSTKGDTITNSSLGSDVNVVCLWASWDNNSVNILRQMHQLQQKNKGRLTVVSVCVDASSYEGSFLFERDSIHWPNICDGKLWQSPLLTKLGMATIGDNIVTDKKGTILARNLSNLDLRQKVDSLLNEK